MITQLRQCKVGAALVLAVIVLAGCDWPQGGFGPAHTGFNRFETSISATSATGLHLRWSQSVSDGLAVNAPAAIADDVVYVSSRKLFALDASTGSARWSSPDVGLLSSSPAVANGVVYVAASRNGNYTLRAFDAASGAARWSKSLGAFGGFSPTVANGVVYVSADKLYAFNATTGSPLWSVVPDRYAFAGSPAVAGNVVYAGADKVYALNATTGARIWSAPRGGFVYGTPSVANGVVYIGADKLYALNATTGVELWSVATPGGPVSPAVANGIVYAGDDSLLALNATTGAQLWSAPTGAGDGGPAVANGVVYVGNVGNQHLHAYNATTGASLWSAPTAVGVSPPAVANGVVYFGAEKIYAYSLPNATPLLTISPAFPADYVFGDPSATTRTFTITNIGTTPTSNIVDGLSGPDAAYFRIVSDGCVGTTLAGGASCTVAVSFAPTRAGRRTAWLATNAAAGGTARALLAGGSQPFTISPFIKDFGGIVAGATSATEFRVTNLSAAAIGPIATAITRPNEYSITADACSGTTLAAATSCIVTVTFAPVFSGVETSDLIAEAPGYHAEASMTGRGLPQLALSPRDNDFGAVAVGATASATFTVKNISPAAALMTTDTIEPYSWLPNSAWYHVTSDACAARFLAAGSSCAIVVTFAPGAAGVGYALLTATAASGSVTATLRGSGT